MPPFYGYIQPRLLHSVTHKIRYKYFMFWDFMSELKIKCLVFCSNLKLYLEFRSLWESTTEIFETNCSQFGKHRMDGALTGVKA